jgi:hypothetical protein
MEVVTGFRPKFTSSPLSLSGHCFNTPSQGKNDHFIDKEVEALLSKGAIEEVPLSPPPPYISPSF